MLAVYLSPIYIALNIYLLVRICGWLTDWKPWFGKRKARAVICLIFLFLAASPLIGFLMPAGPGRGTVMRAGNCWLGLLLYLLPAILTGDLLCLLLRKRLRGRKAWVRGICGMAALGLCLWGSFNARIIRVTPYEITVDKDGGSFESIHVVLIADLHLGYNIGVSHMTQMVERINEQDADLVVIAGDIFDNEYEALKDPEELSRVLRGIRSKYGVFACYGNHDVEEKILAGFTFGGGQKKESSREMDEFLERSGIHLLRDEAVLIGDSLYLYGRPDAQRPGRGISRRKTALQLMEGLDEEKPVIVIDHEPGELEELAEAGADVDLSGHTHDGQMFPANLITGLLWENSYGYRKKEELHSIVTSGVGVFGPFMRVGTIAEICAVRIHFQ